MDARLTAIKRLLSSADLSAVDLTEAHLEHFFVRGPADAPQGVIGLELYPPVALLRSLAVASASRGQGVGTALLLDAEHYARKRDVEEIYLLTTTAEKFFARHGYEKIERDDAPPAIRDTQEFSSVCPVSSALMRKRL